MPRLGQSEREKQYDALLAQIYAFVAKKKREKGSKKGNKSSCEIAAAQLGFGSYDTMNRRMRNPESITLFELQNISVATNLSIPALLGWAVKTEKEKIIE